MKNVLVVDGAQNCEYAIYAFTDAEFATVFPGDGQNVEFIEELIERVGAKEADLMFGPIWKRRIRKPDALGINGTLFYEMLDRKEFYPTKNDEEMVTFRRKE